jgi:hypothetical protein
MVVVEDVNRAVKKQDPANILILLAIALGVGIYLIATTVLIAKDGVLYIKLAQNFSQNPIDIIKRAPPFGYPFLIFLSHKVLTFFSQGDSVYSWIYSAQSVSLLCRVLSLIPLYFIGKLLVGPRRSFWGLLILIMLPYPAVSGSDVIREWPHILFLATGMAFLIYGARKGKWWMFAIAGLAAGLGHTIRAECAQVVTYGILWLLISLFLPRPNMSRLKAICLTLILLIGFAVPIASYMKTRGRILPPKLKKVISYNSRRQSSGPEQSAFNGTLAAYTASGMPTDILQALGKLAQQASENLMHFFVLPLMIGLYCHFRKLRKVLLTERFFIFALIVLYLVMMVLLHINHNYISRRHCMPIVVFSIFYIPVGLQIMARWLSEKTCKRHSAVHRDRRRWFFILMAIGFSICTAKFVRITPLRREKQGYLDSARWLKGNTKPEDIIALSHLASRIGFYAERTTTRTQTRTSMVSAGNISSGTWYHLAGTFDGKHQKLYINGNLAASAEPGFGAIGFDHGNLAIGKPYAGAKSYFNGLISQVRLYSKALSSEDVKALHNHQMPEVEDGKLMVCWPLGGEASEGDKWSEEGIAFDGVKDYVNLSKLDSSVQLGELTISVRVKPEFLNRMNWICGKGAQFRVGVRKSKAYFWIRERPPGGKIPAKATYVVAFAKEGSTELEMSFNKGVEEKYSVWVNNREKKKRIAIYKVL